MPANIAIILPRVLHPTAWLNLSECTDVIMLEGVLDEAAELAKVMERQGVAVIISRGGTSLAIRRAVKIPVVVAEATSFDILETLMNLKNNHPNIKRVGLMNFGNVRYDIDTMNNITGLSIEQYWYKEQSQLRDSINEACNNGVQAIIGGMFVAELARDMGVMGVLQRIGKETTMQALQRARALAAISQYDQVKARQLQSILSFLQDGIIAIDTTGVVISFNEAAERLLNIKANQVIGKTLSEVFPRFNWRGIIDGGTNYIKAKNLQDLQVSVNRIPKVLDQTIIDAVLTLKSIGSNLDSSRGGGSRQLFKATFQFSDVVGHSFVINDVIAKAKLYANTDSTILITGESGTGKEVFAQAIHNFSNRKNGPFIPLNCAAFPQSLLESELFGYEEGAFTGAKKGGKRGMFELSAEGTIFLDEIGEMPLELQSRLLRVVQQRSIMRVGGEKPVPINTRIIAATNRNLLQAVEQKEFRSDLYYRINTMTVALPPLRERLEDIPVFVEYFMKKYSLKYNKTIESIPLSIMDLLNHYPWPGNIRELENFVDRLVVTSGEGKHRWDPVNDLISNMDDGSGHLSRDDKTDMIQIKVGKLNDMIEAIVHKVCVMHGGNKSIAAEILGVSRTTIWKKIKS